MGNNDAIRLWLVALSGGFNLLAMLEDDDEN